jgi:hypothetical protein
MRLPRMSRSSVGVRDPAFTPYPSRWALPQSCAAPWGAGANIACGGESGCALLRELRQKIQNGESGRAESLVLGGARYRQPMREVGQ